MHEPGKLRASDEERERVAAELREHFTQGRLDITEFEDRLARAYAARTGHDLEKLRADLPSPPTPAAARHAALVQRLVLQIGGSLVPFVACTAIWLATGAGGDFWPKWVAIAALFPLLRSRRRRRERPETGSRLSA